MSFSRCMTLTVLFAAITLTAMGSDTKESTRDMNVIGDSLVLAKTQPGTLCFDTVCPGSVVVRSKYDPIQEGSIIYEEGRDYTVDYAKGLVARTEASRIPDFATNVLYGQKNFNHSKFPGFGNRAFYVYVDYKTRNAYPLMTPTTQTPLLAKTRAKLEAGGPFKIVVFGDSITAGIDCSALHLRFQQRYSRHLAKRFPQAQITVENGATNGGSTATGLANIENDVLTRKPDLVLIGYGMNDHNVNGVPVQKFEDNLVTIGTMIRERTGAEVFLYSTFPPNPDWCHSSHQMDKYAAATKQAAKRLNSAYADLNALWAKVEKRKDVSSLRANNINHPSDFGHWLYLLALKSVEF
jgi:acyl-CoA thioesterase I